MQVRPFLNVAGGTIELSDLRGVGGMQVCMYAVYVSMQCVDSLVCFVCCRCVCVMCVCVCSVCMQCDVGLVCCA